MDDRSLLGDVPMGKLNGSKVLVVDDDEEIRIFLTTLFSDEGALVFEAEDGNRTRAAERLGLQRTYLSRLIRQYGLGTV